MLGKRRQEGQEGKKAGGQERKKAGGGRELLLSRENNKTCMARYLFRSGGSLVLATGNSDTDSLAVLLVSAPFLKRQPCNFSTYLSHTVLFCEILLRSVQNGS
jgi:hypothetical protein